MKWRLFRHLLHGGDPDAERVYIWHIEKRRIANRSKGIGMDAGKPENGNYLPAARRLHASMSASGFDRNFAIPIAKDRQLLGGAHRLACAIALDCNVWVERTKTGSVWAPAWDRQWFVENGMSEDDLQRLTADFIELARRQRVLDDMGW